MASSRKAGGGEAMASPAQAGAAGDMKEKRKGGKTMPTSSPAPKSHPNRKIHNPRGERFLKTTRLMVRGLVDTVGREQLRALFEKKVNVTDCNVAMTKEGKHRGFGFLGFRTVEDAEIAKKHFNKTYLGHSKMKIEFAQAIRSKAIPRGWSRYTKGTSRYFENHKEDADAHKKRVEDEKARRAEELALATSGPAQTEEEKEQLAEYLALMAPRKNQINWGNDDTGASSAVAKKAREKLAFEDGEDSGSDGDSEDMPDPDSDSGSSSSESEDDMAFLRSKTVKKVTKVVVEADREMDNGEGDEGHGSSSSSEGEVDFMNDFIATLDGEKAKRQQDSRHKAISSDAGERKKQLEKMRNAVGETGRLFVRNLPLSVGDDDLMAFFRPVGPVLEVHVSRDPKTQKSRGYAFVQFKRPRHAINAMRNLNGSSMQGRIISIVAAAAPKDADRNKVNDDDSYKTKKEKRLRAEAGSAHNWNALFLRSDAVAAAAAAQLGVSASDVVGMEGAEAPAVRLAKAETLVLAQTRAYLQEHGVSLECLASLGANADQKALKRSKSTILVKNLPFETSADELETLFSRYGIIARCVLPPVRTICMIEFYDNSDAKKAFKRLAYTRFKKAPLYLEWAPLEIFNTKAPEKPEVVAGTINDVDEAKEAEMAAEKARMPQSVQDQEVVKVHSGDIMLGDDTQESEEGSTLFLKNVNWSSTEQDVAAHLSTCQGLAPGALRTCTFAKKRNPHNPEEMLSMGYGFVEFDSRASAQLVLKNMQKTLFEGHELLLKTAQEKGTTEVEGNGRRNGGKIGGKNPPSTKVMIRNVAFEATREELKELFDGFTQVKSIRLPKKAAGGHRGFAFVEFLTKKEATRAIETLGNTHFYGRHLVLEFAREDKSLSAARERAGRLNRSSGHTAKRRYRED